MASLTKLITRLFGKPQVQTTPQEAQPMTKVLVLYHSMYGHIETMANSVADGARRIDGVEVTVKRVPETMNEEIFKNAGGKWDQEAPVATPQELEIGRASCRER